MLALLNIILHLWNGYILPPERKSKRCRHFNRFKFVYIPVCRKFDLERRAKDSARSSRGAYGNNCMRFRLVARNKRNSAFSHVAWKWIQRIDAFKFCAKAFVSQGKVLRFSLNPKHMTNPRARKLLANTTEHHWRFKAPGKSRDLYQYLVLGFKIARTYMHSGKFLQRTPAVINK